MIGRGAKASGKYKDYFNVQYENKEKGGIYMDNIEWKNDETEEEEEENFEDANYAMIPIAQHGEPKCIEAKEIELKAFRDFDVYEEVVHEDKDRLNHR